MIFTINVKDTNICYPGKVYISLTRYVVYMFDTTIAFPRKCNVTHHACLPPAMMNKTEKTHIYQRQHIACNFRKLASPDN